MNTTVLSLRSTVALMLVVLGLVIFGRGIVEGDPVMYTLMGALMAGLGIYRLRLLGGAWRHR